MHEEVKDLEARVDRGVAFLDKEFPDWRKHIDLDTLSMESHCQCIVGQLRESDDVPDAVRNQCNTYLSVDDHLGFCLPDELLNATSWPSRRPWWNRLSNLWRHRVLDSPAEQEVKRIERNEGAKSASHDRKEQRV